MPLGASIYHLVRERGGVHEMTMNDHEGGGEGSLNDHVVTWTKMYFASDQKKLCEFSISVLSYMTNVWL